MTETPLPALEQLVEDITEELLWYLPDRDQAAEAALRVIATAAQASPSPNQTHMSAPPAAPAPLPRAVTPGLAVPHDTVLVDLPDPTAPGARAWIRDRHGEIMVDDGRRLRQPDDAEQDGLALVAAARLSRRPR